MTTRAQKLSEDLKLLASADDDVIENMDSDGILYGAAYLLRDLEKDHDGLAALNAGLTQQLQTESVRNSQLKQQCDDLLAAINDVLDGTSLDKLGNRNDDGMLNPFNQGFDRRTEMWAEKLKKARRAEADVK